MKWCWESASFKLQNSLDPKRVAEGTILLHTVPTKTNPADLGTKRLARARVRFLMFFCGVCSADSGEPVGSELHVHDDSSRINRMVHANAGDHEAIQHWQDQDDAIHFLM